VLYNTQYHRTSERDYTGHDVSLAWLHDLKNERTTLKFLLGVNQTDYREDEDNPGEEIRDRTARGLFGLKHRFTETSGVECAAGARFTESDIRDGDDTTEHQAGFIGSAAFTWQYERSTVQAVLTRDYEPSTAGGGATRDVARLTLSHRFTERLGASIAPAYRRTDREKEDRPDRTEWTFSVRPSARYRVTPSVFLSLGYSYYRVDRGAEAEDETETRNRVWLGLTWNIHEPEWTVRPPRELVEWPHRY
jgi:predicted porin